MATNFPSSIDNFTNPTSSSTMASPSHSAQHADVNDAVEAIETALLDGAPLYIDDANERVGIGTVAPSTELEVDGTVTATEFVGDLQGATHIKVKNASGGSLSKGTPVYAAGSVGASGSVEVQASLAGTASTMPALGLLDETLANNAEGSATIIGVVRQEDTSSYSVNDSLYVAVSGGLTNVRPTGASELVQKIGRVVRADASNGEILVLGAGRANDVPNNVVAGGLTIDTDTLHVDATNDRVGIGTTTPAGDLHIDGSSIITFTNSANTVGKQGMRLAFDNDRLTVQRASDAGAFEANHVAIDQDTGNVGIGTTTPDRALTVAGGQSTIANFTSTSATSSISFVGSGTTNDTSVRVGAVGDQMKLIAGDTERVRIDASGNVGINDTTPSYKLDVNGDINATGDVRVAGNPVGMVLVKSQTVGSGVSSVTVTNAFSSTFDNYLITDNGGAQSVDTALMFFFGSTQTGTDYYQSLNYVPFTTGTPTGIGHSLRSEWVYCGGSSGMRNAHITVMNPGVADYKNMHAVVRYSVIYGTATGYYAAATAHTDFTLKPATGTMTGGTIRVYGYNNG